MNACTVCLLELGLAARETPDPARTGRLLDYVRVVNILGDGPRAQVFLAEWTTPGGGVVALKRGKQAALPARARDSQKLLQLDHPGVATFFEAGVAEDGAPYAITEYVPGRPITRYAERECLSHDQRISLWMLAADALSYVHAQGISHLNLKPSNVLVAGGVVKVLDFDAAMPAAGMHAEALVDARADVCALGAILRELVATAAGASLQHVIRVATAPDPEARYQTLDAFASAVRASLT